MPLLTDYQREWMLKLIKSGYKIETQSAVVVLINPKTKSTIPLYSCSLYSTVWPENRQDHRPEDEVRTQIRNLAETLKQELES